MSGWPSIAFKKEVLIEKKWKGGGKARGWNGWQ